MTDDLTLETDNDSDLVKNLRKQLGLEKKARADAEAGNAAATKSLGERNLSDVLKAKKLKPELARFIQSDGVDATDTPAVEQWIAENAATFGFEVPVEENDTSVSEVDQAAHEAIQNVPATPASSNKLQKLFDEADAHPEWTAAENLAFFRSSGLQLPN